MNKHSTIAALLVFPLLTVAATAEEPAYLLVGASRINPAGCAVLAIAPVPSLSCGDDEPVNYGALAFEPAVYSRADATCAAIFERMTSGRWLLFIIDEDLEIIGELSVCLPDHLDGRNVFLVTDHHRIMVDGFESGDLGSWAVVGGR